MSVKRVRQRKPKVVMTGATGFIGKALTAFLMDNGYRVLAISRRDLALGVTHIARMINGADVVINLAGASILKRWSEAYKEEILKSRVDTTQMLVKACSQTKISPRLFVSTSAVGVYNNIDVHDEFSTLYGDSFLTKVCLDWEEATHPLIHCDSVRLVIFRLGTVLGANGGAFLKMQLPVKCFLGGRIASGKQWFPYIHIDDVLSAFWFAIKNINAAGVYNLVTPNSVTNEKFMRVLAHKNNRPMWLPVPAFMLKLIYGEGATVLTQGQYVKPHRLVDEGFHFQYPTLEKTLDNLLKKH